ncbi:MAG: KpsF/GutQ family sugar-phosphate isomerase [Desulfovibrionaceae bacterium]|nr:KpsF/GutQ family sugar-phosphate isomerase [Desulfovibrionaceae bacterium]
MKKRIRFSADRALQQGIDTIRQEGEALLALSACLGETFALCVACLLRIEGRVCVTGMGKSGHIARKVAATMASTGTPAYFIHPADASHGDLGMMTPRDALVAISNSGNTSELSDILFYAQAHALPVIAITSNPESPLGKHATHCLVLPTVHEACPLDCAPTTSTTMSLALGDALAMALMRERGFTPEDFKSFHPGGNLGQKLLRVRDIMHTGQSVPLCDVNDPMSVVIVEMSRKMLGCVGVRDHGRLVGIITDGDLRRAMCPEFLTKRAEELMTVSPHTIDAEASVATARQKMKRLKVTSLFVHLEKDNVGIVHIHDLE